MMRQCVITNLRYLNAKLLCVQGPKTDHDFSLFLNQCQNYQSVNKSDQCLFVKNESTCHSDGLIQYTEFVFCELNSALVPLAISILVSVSFLFIDQFDSYTKFW